MEEISFRKIAAFMDPVRPPNRLRGSQQHDYDKSDESKWLQGGATAKSFAADFGLYHSKSKGLFQVHQGNSNSFREIGERHIGIQSQHHKMLVYNTYLLDSPVISSPLRTTRSMEIGRMIGREGYDIACLCEVFNGDDGKRIKKSVNDYGGVWEEGFGPDSSVLNISGGLYGLIKKIKHRRLKEYKNKKFSDGGEGADEWSNKGWMLMEVDLGVGTLDIFSTHTDAGLDDVKSRSIQIGELIKAIKERQKKYPDHITMAVGDFNVYSSTIGGKVTILNVEYNITPEYEWLLKEMWTQCSMRDLWLTRGGKASATHAFAQYCTNNGLPDCACDDYNSSNYRGDRLDYIFVQDPRPQHTMNLDFSRIRRKPFSRLKPCGEHDRESLITESLRTTPIQPIPSNKIVSYLSDHVGLHLEFVSSPRSKS